MDAITFSSLLVLMSLGLTLTFLTTGVPNFAHGGLATIGTYVALTLHKVHGLNIYLSLPPSFFVTGLIALGFYLLALRPLMKRGASILALMIATIAFDILLLAALNIYADYLQKTFGVASRWFYLRGADFTFLGQQGLLLVVLLLVAMVTISLHAFLTRTKFGIAMRATIENPALAGAVGVDVDLVYKVSWFLAGGLAGVAGSLLPLRFFSNPDIGTSLLISIFAASIVGGLRKIYGGLVGGYIIGCAEVLLTGGLALALGSWIIPYRPIIPLSAMIVVLLAAPQGVTEVALGLRRARLRGGGGK